MIPKICDLSYHKPLIIILVCTFLISHANAKVILHSSSTWAFLLQYLPSCYSKTFLCFIQYLNLGIKLNEILTSSGSTNIILTFYFENNPKKAIPTKKKKKKTYLLKYALCKDKSLTLKGPVNSSETDVHHNMRECWCFVLLFCHWNMTEYPPVWIQVCKMNEESIIIYAAD